MVWFNLEKKLKQVPDESLSKLPESTNPDLQPLLSTGSILLTVIFGVGRENVAKYSAVW